MSKTKVSRKVKLKTSKYDEDEQKVRRKSKSKTRKADADKPKKKKKKAKHSSADTIVLKDKIYIPVHAIDVEEATKEYTHHMFVESVCRSCEYRPERPTFQCNQCPMEGYKGAVRTCSGTKVMNKGRYMGFPIGDITRVEKRLNISFDDFNIKDRRIRNKFTHPVRMRKSFKLRDHQAKATKKWKKKGHGLIVAPPRSGKCVTGDTIIHTSAGAVPIKSLFQHSPAMKDGEQYLKRRPFKILTAGGEREATHIYRKEVTRVTHVQTASGFKISGVKEHPLLVLRPNLTLEWVELKDMVEGDVLCISKGQSLFGRKHTAPRELEKARFLGYMAGSGYLGGASGISFSTDSAAIAKDFEHCYYRVFYRQFEKQTIPELETHRSDDGKITIRVLSKYVREWFTNLDQKGTDRVIPNFVQTGTRQIQRNYMRALFLAGEQRIMPAVPLSELALKSEDRKFLADIQLLLLMHGHVGAIFVGGPRHKRLTHYLRLNKTTAFVKYFGGEFIHSPFALTVPYVHTHIREERALTESQLLAVDPNTIRDANISTSVELLQSKNFVYDRVSSINEELGNNVVYDVTVPKGHHYVGNGIVSHNTPTMLDLCIGLGYRTIILANQHDFLNQFLEHIEEMTNLPALERKTGKKLYGYAKKPEDFDTLEICLCTFQQFTHKSAQSKARFKAAKKNFGTLFVDECFTYGHKVQTELGLLPIGAIVEGSVVPKTVLSYNHETGKPEYKQIESFTKKKTKQLCKVLIDGTQYMCTPNHEFYVEGKGYVAAKNLKAGDNVRNL